MGPQFWPESTYRLTHACKDTHPIIFVLTHLYSCTNAHLAAELPDAGTWLIEASTLIVWLSETESA